MTPTFWDHVFAVVLGVAFPVLGAVQRRGAHDDGPAEPMDSGDKIRIYWANALTLWVLTIVTVLVWHRGDRTLGDLGLAAPAENLAVGLALAALFVAVYLHDTWRQLGTPQRLAETRARWRRDTPFMPATRREILHSIALVTAAAVGEEILFRGFLIGYLIGLFGTSVPALVAAVALPALVFGACHLYQDLRAVAKIVLLSCVFGAILVVTGSLWIPILLHFLVDLVALSLGPRLLAVPVGETES